MITMIPRSRLEPHPDNPRKDLGDLTELAASIKRSGLLQNLTVVPHPDKPDMYRIIIGHRRFAASAMVDGYNELPCAIEDMSLADQIATMMTENMQRNDLTIADQIGGVQMMMDLGESVQAIATKTGLSETSIRKRVTLTALPKQEMRVAVDKGATLLDLMNIMELEDPDERENVLKEFGTNNWQYSLNAAKGRQEQKAFRAKIVPWLEEHKIKTTKNSSEVYGPKYKYVTQWSRNSTDELKFPQLEDGKHYIYVDSSWSITLYVRDDEYIEQKEESKKNDRIRKAMMEKGQELNRQAYELRCTFVRKYRCNDAKRKAFWEKLFGFIVAQRGYAGWSELASYHNWSMSLIRDMLAIPIEEGRDKEETFEAELKRRGITKECFLLAWALNGGVSEERVKHGYCNDYDGGHRKDDKLDAQYEFLTGLGYEMSDFEKSLRNGTHPFFKNPEVEI